MKNALGMLVYRSGFLPRFLGVWLIVNGVTYVLMSLAGILTPTYQDLVGRYGQPALMGELALVLWLLIKGGQPPWWSERQAVSATD